MELISLAALAIVIALSCFTKVNPGLLSLGLAWLLGYYGARIGIPQIVAGFPTHMFLVLVGVTYLFSIAKQNGTLDRLAQVSLRMVKNDPAHAPILFFIMAAVLSAAGASNIGAVALLAPIAMAVAWQTGIGAFFMTIILVCGANAGTFSPFALTGIIANGLIAKLGLTMDPWMQVFIPNLAAQTVLAVIVYILLSWKIKAGKKPLRILTVDTESLNKPWDANQKFTLVAIVALIAGSVILKTDIGFLSLTLAAVLTVFAANQGKEALKHIPWDTILMVCGINTLIGIMESLGGLGLLSDLLAKVSTPQNVTAVTALTTGILSAFSSSSGVVLPSFIPLVPQLIEKIGGGSATAIVSSINVGSHLVDISPLSSLGALCIASALHEDKEKLFRNLLGFGLSMAVVGALLCFLLFGWMKA